MNITSVDWLAGFGLGLLIGGAAAFAISLFVFG